MTDLKPCPFCGGKAEIREKRVHVADWFGKDYRVMYRVACKKCKANTGGYAAGIEGKEWTAIERWNRRDDNAK